MVLGEEPDVTNTFKGQQAATLEVLPCVVSHNKNESVQHVSMLYMHPTCA